MVGGPHGDTGLTGRKIIVDTYGGWGRHGGGAFSGKDPTKVDRSAAYMARHVAKNIVAAGLADRCEVQLAYAIGVSEPVSVHVDTDGTGRIDDERICEIVRDLFPLTPGGIIKYLDLRRPIYRKTAAGGHFGRERHRFHLGKNESSQRTGRSSRRRRGDGLTSVQIHGGVAMDAALVSLRNRIASSRAISIESIRTPAAILLIGLLVSADALLLLRRLAGALSEPLPIASLLAVGIAAAVAAIAAIAILATPSVKWCASLSLPVLAFSVSLPGSSPIGLSALWLAIGVAEVAIWKFDQLLPSHIGQRLTPPPLKQLNQQQPKSKRSITQHKN